MLFRLLPRRQSPPALPPRRRRIAVVRLGSRRGWRSGRRFFVGFLRRVRLGCLVAQYRKALKRVRARCAALMWDLIDGAATIEAVHSRTLTESYFPAIVGPKPIIVASCPNYYKF